MTAPLRRRTRAREIAMQALFQFDMRGSDYVAELGGSFEDICRTELFAGEEFNADGLANTADRPLNAAEREVVDFSVRMVEGTLQHRDDSPFRIGTGDYRVIADDAPDQDLVMGHVSTNFDRSGFEQDLNVVLPRARLHELAAAGKIGSVAKFHYAFMGSTDPMGMESAARTMAGYLKADSVDTVFLLPV